MTIIPAYDEWYTVWNQTSDPPGDPFIGDRILAWQISEDNKTVLPITVFGVQKPDAISNDNGVYRLPDGPSFDSIGTYENYLVDHTNTIK